MNINELREKRAKAWEATKAFLENQRTEKGTLSAEDDQTYNRMMEDINSLGKVSAFYLNFSVLLQTFPHLHRR